MKFVLTLSCKDRPGLVAAVATQLFEKGGNILDARQFDDKERGSFFMRVVFESSCSEGDLRAALTPLGSRLEMDWKLRPVEQRQRVLLLVSKLDHCLGDL